MTSDKSPLISVIVATKDRQEAIIPCLDAIQKSMLKSGHDKYELVVVNNNSTDKTEELVKGWIEKSKIAAKIVLEKKAGLSAARNCGIRNVTGDILVFTDDDCHPSEDYFKQVLDYHAQDGAELIMRSGSVVLGDPTDLEITIKPVHAKRIWKKPMSVMEEGELLGNALIGCNMVMSRQVVDMVGLFDEKLGAGQPTKAAEDTDYYYRGYIKGIKLEIVPDLEIAHFHGRKNPEVKQALLRNYAIGGGALVLKYLFIYPRFSRHLYWLVRDYIKREIIAGKKPDDGRLSRKDRLLCYLKGMGIYAKLWFKEKLYLNR